MDVKHLTILHVVKQASNQRVHFLTIYILYSVCCTHFVADTGCQKQTVEAHTRLKFYSSYIGYNNCYNSQLMSISCFLSASCAIVRPYEALIIGVIGAVVSLLCSEVIGKLKIDDPVGAVAVHGAGGIWVGLLVGFV